MARSDDAPLNNRGRGGRGRGRGHGGHMSRTTLISKACSKLLRHQAVNEGIPITNDGWVRLDHLLAWRGLSGRNGVSPPPTIEDIFEVVEVNEKKRFALRLIGAKTERNEVDDGAQAQPVSTVEELMTAEGETESSVKKEKEAETAAENETVQAISYHRSSKRPPDAQEFLIRAVQGHSIQAVASDTSLLKPISLDDPSSIPETCVHGTFYGAWKDILRSGGLKRMGRNHVHFAAGPSLEDIGITEEGSVINGKSDKVISGMRHDAQLLIYIDLRLCLEDFKQNDVEMLWWRSENGVILTEGVEADLLEAKNKPEATTSVEAEQKNRMEDDELVERAKNTVTTVDLVVKDHSSSGNAELEPCEHTAQQDGSTANSKDRSQQPTKGGNGKQAQGAAQNNKLVPMKYWKVVVDVKGGHGVIWRQSEGEVKQLPENLLSKGTPKFRGGSRGRGKSR